MTPSLDQRFADAMGAALGPEFPADIGLAVSGGGDSMAMLTLAHNWTHRWGVRLWVVTVDHGLRPEAAAEAALVRDTCAELGWPHATLRWHWDGQGNLMDAARRGRLSLIGRWRGGLPAVLFAHTRDDVAETFLMRLARGSGVDGLSAMAPVRGIRDAAPPAPLTEDECCGNRPPGIAADGFRVVRPCLDMGREELRHYLRVLKGRWVDDPSNEDPHYDRARVRKLLAELAPQGLGTETLAATAGRMSRAREALRARAVAAWHSCGREGVAGDLILERDAFAALEADTRMRLLAAALQYVSSAEYRPRAAQLEALLDRLDAGAGGTLHGAELRCDRAEIRILREYAAVAGLRRAVTEGGLWDGRWRVSHPTPSGLEIRALGEDGWRQSAERRAGGPPHAVARALPAIWDGDRLVACDALGIGPGGTTRLCPGGIEGQSYPAFLLSH